MKTPSKITIVAFQSPQGFSRRLEARRDEAH